RAQRAIWARLDRSWGTSRSFSIIRTTRAFRSASNAGSWTFAAQCGRQPDNSTADLSLIEGGKAEEQTLRIGTVKSKTIERLCLDTTLRRPYLCCTRT